MYSLVKKHVTICLIGDFSILFSLGHILFLAYLLTSHAMRFGNCFVPVFFTIIKAV